MTFREANSLFNKGITVQAAAGVILSESVSTEASASVFHAGMAPMTVVDGKALSTTNQHLTIRADDLQYEGGEISAGAWAMRVECTSPDRSMGLGDGTGDFSIDTTELQRTTALGMVIGGSNCGNQDVVGISSTHSADITGIPSLPA